MTRVPWRADRLLSSETLLAASIVIGIAAPPVAAVLGPWLYVFVFFLMLFSTLNINLGELWPDGGDGRQVARIVGWHMLVLPAVIGVCHRFAPLAGQWSELMLITACAGTIFGAPAFARVMQLDAILTLRGVIAGTLLMPVVLPVLVPIVTQRATDFDLAAYVLRLCIFIAVPLAAAHLYQRRFAGGAQSESRLFSGLTLLFLALFGIAIMDGIGPMFVADPWGMTGLLAFALAVHALFFALSWLVFMRSGKRQALTAGLLSGYRNLALVLAVGGGLLPVDFIVFAALWQIPMYVTPLAMKLRGSRPPAGI